MPPVAAEERPGEGLPAADPEENERLAHRPAMGLRRRRHQNVEPRPVHTLDRMNNNEDGVFPERSATRRTTRSSWTAWNVSQWYCWMSALGALGAILMAPSTTHTTLTVQIVSSSSGITKNISFIPNAAVVLEKKPIIETTTTTEFPLWRWMTQLLPSSRATKLTPSSHEEPTNHGPWWWPFGSRNAHDDDASARKGESMSKRRGGGAEEASLASWWPTSTDDWQSTLLRVVLFSWIDPNLIPPIDKPVDTIITNLIDKVLTSTLRILFIANWLIALTVLLHTAVADYFLGGRTDASADETRRPRERVGGFLIFKFLLISAMVAPDTFDVLILLSWYTALSFLRSLAALCAQHTERARLLQRRPVSGALQLLALVLSCDGMAAMTCLGLFHGAGYGMVLLLTCDCLLLALDSITHIIQYYQAILDAQHSHQLQGLEERQLALHRASSSLLADDVAARSRALDHEMEALEQHHGQTTAVLETIIFVVQLWTDFLTMAHFLHIWTLHGLHFTFIDGVIALHLHSAILSAVKKLAERRSAHRIAREMDALFANATDGDLQQAATAGDVCCICLGTMSAGVKDSKPGGVKKVACGHLYHATCLREVMERARSMEAARCPLCRAFFVPRKEAPPREEPVAVAREPEEAVAPPVAVEGERALFRFSTEGLFPNWIPLPAFSFEVVRRPLVPEPTDNPPRNDLPAAEEPSLLRRLLLLTGAVPLSPAEELAALEQLVDMFPQYDRLDLQRALRDRGSLDAVVESILLGALVGVPRGVVEAGR
jgi:Ring finger domain